MPLDETYYYTFHMNDGKGIEYTYNASLSFSPIEIFKTADNGWLYSGDEYININQIAYFDVITKTERDANDAQQDAYMKEVSDTINGFNHY